MFTTFKLPYSNTSIAIESTTGVPLWALRLAADIHLNQSTYPRVFVRKRNSRKNKSVSIVFLGDDGIAIREARLYNSDYTRNLLRNKYIFLNQTKDA